MEGFSFCGKHCSDFGIGYIPNDSDRMPTQPDYKVVSVSVTGHDGEYYYGETIEPKEFKLSCYVSDISESNMEKILQWMRRGAYGKLIFDDRPAIYYNARVTKAPDGKLYGSKTVYGEKAISGKLEFELTAFDAFGHFDEKYIDGIDDKKLGIYTGVLPFREMPPAPNTSSRYFLLYNPGTEPCQTIIRIAGESSGEVLIRNRTNGDVCVINSLPLNPETNHLEINGETGAVYVKPQWEDEYAFEFHDKGYIRLSPFLPMDRDVLVAYSKNDNRVYPAVYTPQEEDVGRWILLDGTWYKIIAIQNEKNFVVNEFLPSSWHGPATIVTMNEIEITGQDLDLTKLEFDFHPLVR